MTPWHLILRTGPRRSAGQSTAGRQSASDPPRHDAAGDAAECQSLLPGRWDHVLRRTSAAVPATAASRPAWWVSELLRNGAGGQFRRVADHPRATRRDPVGEALTGLLALSAAQSGVRILLVGDPGDGLDHVRRCRAAPCGCTHPRSDCQPLPLSWRTGELRLLRSHRTVGDADLASGEQARRQIQQRLEGREDGCGRRRESPRHTCGPRPPDRPTAGPARPDRGGTRTVRPSASSSQRRPS